MESKGHRKLKVAIIHPDLGIGGAERLIVDAAVELVSHGHSVHVFTAHHDKSHCFEETISGKFQVTVYGSFLPRHLFYRFHAVCAYLRCIFVTLCVLFMRLSFDIVLADQVSVVVPLLKLKRSAKVIFYCHFPDLLLAQHTTWLRRLYRKPIDLLEEKTTGMANLILVNSRFTRSTFAATFRGLHGRGIEPVVLYPAVNVQQFKEQCSYKPNFLSINRFERKKNLQLAISAFSLLVSSGTNSCEATLTIAAKNSSMEECATIRVRNFVSVPNSPDPHTQDMINEKLKKVEDLGGFDRRLKENVEYLDELKKLAEVDGVSDRVMFVTSCSTEERNILLSQCLCVLYTPKDEHFGIVPLEAMASQKPVIACNSGGPMETVKHEVTGFLCEPTPSEFSKAMSELLSDAELTIKMGREARRHVAEMFSTKTFGEQLNRYVLDTYHQRID